MIMSLAPLNGGQALLLRAREFPVVSAEKFYSSIMTAELKRWQGKVEWRRRDGQVERKAMAGDGNLSSNGGEEENENLRAVRSRYDNHTYTQACAHEYTPVNSTLVSVC